MARIRRIKGEGRMGADRCFAAAVRFLTLYLVSFVVGAGEMSLPNMKNDREGCGAGLPQAHRFRDLTFKMYHDKLI